MARQLETEAPKIGVQATALVTASFLSGKQAFSYMRGPNIGSTNMFYLT
jgi:Na+/phosphate symporter